MKHKNFFYNMMNRERNRWLAEQTLVFQIVSVLVESGVPLSARDVAAKLPKYSYNSVRARLGKLYTDQECKRGVIKRADWMGVNRQVVGLDNNNGQFYEYSLAFPKELLDFFRNINNYR